MALNSARGRSRNSPRSMSGGGIEIALHGIRGREHAGRVLDVAARIEPVDREDRERGHNQGSKTHGGES